MNSLSINEIYILFSDSGKREFQNKLHDVQKDTILLQEANGLAEIALGTANGEDAAKLTKLNARKAEILLAFLDAKRAAAERRARGSSLIQRFVKCVRIIIARNMAEKVIYFIFHI